MRHLFVAVSVALSPTFLVAQSPTIGAFTASMQHMPGFVDVYLEDSTGKVFLGIDAFDQELLYATAQASGLGSNPVGLDRGSLGPQHVIEFRRAGPKVLVLAKNLGFRAASDNARERLAVAESFAPSVLAALKVAAAEGDGVLVDATEFFLRDATDVIGRLQRAGQGKYSLDRERSVIWTDRTKAFPDNTEIETLLTFGSDKPGSLVRRTAAAGESVTLRQHHSFVRLPDEGYRPRRFDPRVGYFGPRFLDYAAPIGTSMDRHYIARHRLQKKDPAAAKSDPVEPLVYYIDPGTPEPVRSALREGAMWWAEAFEAAGFTNAFRVEMLPPDADPMDVRYNMIHWVHRRTRGWSYGASIQDPRTGEILKGNVLLGSLRVRQDHMKFVGLQSPYQGAACAAGASPSAEYLVAGDDELAQLVALARIRQLAAHEVGHTLGLSHNFAASTYGRASVMDYPAPLVQIDEDGELDFSDAYDVGIGEYDTFAIVYGYSQFAEGADEDAELERIVRDGLAKGYVFLTDQDARSPGTAHPLASLWDNGADPIARLRTELEVRRIGLRKFGIGALRPGATLASLEDTLVPLYLHHRFQLDAVMKLIGGVDFRHAVKGDGQPEPSAVPIPRQRNAFSLALATLRPAFLKLDPRLLAKIPPAPPGHPGTAERFPRTTGQLLDPVALAEVSAGLTLDGLLNPQRAARLNHLGDRGFTFRAVLDRIVEVVFGKERLSSSRLQSLEPVQVALRELLVDRLMDLAADESAASSVRTDAEVALLNISLKLATGSIQPRINAFFADPGHGTRRAPALDAPPGSPIGGR